MWEKLKIIIVTVLATLGVLFILIMLIPDDEETETQPQEIQAVQESVEDSSDATAEGSVGESSDVTAEESVGKPSDVTAEGSVGKPSDVTAEGSVGEFVSESEKEREEDAGNTSAVDIPASEISDITLKFKTRTLDGKIVDQDIFSGYDITLVHVWGTFCGPCLSEMGDYARSYKNLPENVNLIGIVVDVYDGIDNNADYAQTILDDAGAEFTNLVISDSVYDLVRDVSVIPSSFFVDSRGHIIGEKMVGAHHKETMARLYGYLK